MRCSLHGWFGVLGIFVIVAAGRVVPAKAPETNPEARGRLLSPLWGGPQSWSKRVLYAWPSTSIEGADPNAALIADAKGNLYGTTVFAGPYGAGTIFELTPPLRAGGTWTHTELYAFKGLGDGQWPQGRLLATGNGVKYGTASAGGVCGVSNCGGTVFALIPALAGKSAPTLSVLYAFKTGLDGFEPNSGVIADTRGALYGTATFGGAAAVGVVYKLSPPGPGASSWSESVLYAFRDRPDGARPISGLVADSHGTLYGTTYYGGTYGQGTVYSLTPPARGQSGWTERLLYSFSGGVDGGAPWADLVADERRGRLYGIASSGGPGGGGVVFSLTPPASGQAYWNERIIHAFSGGLDGGYPIGGLVETRRGVLYGTTARGGGVCGCGVVFKLVPSPDDDTTWTETVLHTFTGGADGVNPQATLLLDGEDQRFGSMFRHRLRFFGSTYNGGSGQSGTIFELFSTRE